MNYTIKTTRLDRHWGIRVIEEHPGYLTQYLVWCYNCNRSGSREHGNCWTCGLKIPDRYKFLMDMMSLGI